MSDQFTTDLRVRTLSLAGLNDLVEELEFVNPESIRNLVPMVYLLVTPEGAVAYIGKSDATTGTAARRVRNYNSWVTDYLRKSERGSVDTTADPAKGDLELVRWSPIIRFAALHELKVKVADVTSTGETGRVWEARLQALQGCLTALESVVGGSGWEADGDTLRGRGYDWAIERISKLRKRGVIV